MDTGKVLLRQLRYCIECSDTPEQREQAQWWKEKILELTPFQPSAEPSAAVRTTPDLENSLKS